MALPGCNVNLVGTHGGITVGKDGASHQALEDIAVMRAIPAMTVIVPADAVETRKAVEAAAWYDGPVYIRLTREKLPVIYPDEKRFRIGVGSVVREGDDVTLFGHRPDAARGAGGGGAAGAARGSRAGGGPGHGQAPGRGPGAALRRADRLRGHRRGAQHHRGAG